MLFNLAIPFTSDLKLGLVVETPSPELSPIDWPRKRGCPAPEVTRSSVGLWATLRLCDWQFGVPQTWDSPFSGHQSAETPEPGPQRNLCLFLLGGDPKLRDTRKVVIAKAHGCKVSFSVWTLHSGCLHSQINQVWFPQGLINPMSASTDFT